MIVKKLEESNGNFEKEQKTKLKYFLNLCKYDVIPSAIVGSATSAMFANVYSPSGLTDVILFGGVTGTALILAINGAITGIKASKEDKQELKKYIKENDNNEQRKGKQI